MSHYTEASQHTWVWMNNCMRSLIFLGGSALAVVPHPNRIKTECFCECRQRCRASVGVEVQFVEFSPSVENSPKWSWGVFLLLCEVGYLPRSVTWVTRHFMWPLSLWMKTTPSPASVHRQKVDKQLLPGNQNWLPYCCFESPHFPPLPLLISSIVIIDVDISIIIFFFLQPHVLNSFWNQFLTAVLNQFYTSYFGWEPLVGKKRDVGIDDVMEKKRGRFFLSSWRCNWAMWLWRGELSPLLLYHHGTLFQREICTNFNRKQLKLSTECEETAFLRWWWSMQKLVAISANINTPLVPRAPIPSH